VYGLIPSSGILPPLFEAVKRLVHDVTPLMKELAKTRVPVSPVGLLYSHATHLATQDHTVWEALRGSHGNGYSMQVATHFRAVFANRIPPDIVYPGDDFNRYRILIAPALQVVTRELADKLERFASQGGILVLGMPCGVLDQQAREWEVPVPAHLDRLAGACVEGYGLPRIHNVRLAMTPEPGTDLPALADPSLVTRLQVYPETEILARYEGSDRFAGWPAVLRRSHGQGRVYTLAGIGDEAFLAPLYGALMRDWNLKPEVQLPDGVFAMKREGREGAFHFFFNATASPVRLDLPFAGTDAFTGAPVQSLALAPGRSAIIRA
jgi:beta-galactosidase